MAAVLEILTVLDIDYHVITNDVRAGARTNGAKAGSNQPIPIP
jgi:hypothetical protein